MMSKNKEKQMLKKYMSYSDSDMDYWDDVLDMFDLNESAKVEKTTINKSKKESTR
jgi:hypothetical protein